MTETIKNNKYYNNFKNKNKDKLEKPILCAECGNYYKYFGKSHHFKSKKHNYGVIQKKYEELLIQEGNKALENTIKNNE